MMPAITFLLNKNESNSIFDEILKEYPIYSYFNKLQILLLCEKFINMQEQFAKIFSNIIKDKIMDFVGQYKIKEVHIHVMYNKDTECFIFVLNTNKNTYPDYFYYKLTIEMLNTI